MPTYSSAEFYNQWRYGVKKEFTDASGEPVKYAPDGFRTWGSENYKIECKKETQSVAVSSDGSLLAIAMGEDVHVYDTIDFSLMVVCKGHVSRINALAFQPGNPKVLVSGQDGHGAYEKPPAEPQILFWNLDEQRDNPMMGESVVTEIARQATETVVQGLLRAQSDLEISNEEREKITEAIDPVITRIIKMQKVAKQKSLDGRLQSSFQSQVFSPSGSAMIYLPGRSPRSNGSDTWDIAIHSMVNEKTLTLTGHRDAIMWTGYSPDEKWIGSVAWDKSIRIWNSTTGLQKGRFNTTGQNWTGGFSPDSTKFAATCGDGSFDIYSLVDGTTLVHSKGERNSWMRALSWAPDSKTVAIGEGHGPDTGKFLLYDVERKEVVQERILSTENCPVTDEYKRFMGTYLECVAVQFVDHGKKVVVLTSGDAGIETYDLEKGLKWRFVRPGVDIVEGQDVKVNEETEDVDFENPLVHGGYSMTVWEDDKRGKVWYASLDGDAVRIWDVPMTTESSV